MKGKKIFHLSNVLVLVGIRKSNNVNLVCYHGNFDISVFTTQFVVAYCSSFSRFKLLDYQIQIFDPMSGVGSYPFLKEIFFS